MDIEKSLAAMVSLTEHNHVLEEENKALALENKQLKLRAERKPKLAITITADTPGNDEKDDPLFGREGNISTDDDMCIHLTVGSISTNSIEANYRQMSKADFTGELRGRVTDEEIQRYNDSLPSEKVLKAYLSDYWQYAMMREHGIASVLHIHDNGTAKATDISATIAFPEEIRVLSIEDARDITEPEAPPKPRSLQEIAYMRAHKAEIALNNVYTQFDSQSTINPLHWATLNPASYHTNIAEMEIDDSIIDVEVRTSIVHTKSTWFRGIYLVPLRKGVFHAKATLMCAEYEEPDRFEMVFICE